MCERIRITGRDKNGKPTFLHIAKKKSKEEK
jgi:hypothetical protein